MRGKACVLACFLFIQACGERLGSRPALTLDPVLARTEEVVLALSGSGPPEAIVNIEGGLSPSVAGIGADGRFRVLVALKLGMVNRLVVFPELGGIAGVPAEVVVEQVLPLEAVRPVDTTPPPLPVLDPIGPRVGSTLVALRGTAESAATVLVRDPYQIQEVPVDSSTGRFSAMVRLRTEGYSSVQVVAIDAAGNRSPEAVVNLLYDRSLAAATPDPPRRPSLDPAPRETAGTRVTLSGRAEPYAQVVVEGGEAPGLGLASATGEFAVGVALRIGARNELSAQVVDDFGHRSEPAVVRIAQTGPPRGTRYPLVLAHGFGASREVLGILPYWWRVREELEAHGFEVFEDDVSPIHSVEHRAAQLREQINRYTSGRVNLIGHSMGGLDSRYLISRLGFGERVVSLTTLSTPHHGSPVADAALEAAGPQAYAAAELLFRYMGYSLAAARALSVRGAATEFNPSTPDDPRVAYFSYGGIADPLGRTGNHVAPYLVATWAFIYSCEGDNDGFVSVSSSRWGEYLGTLRADHYDEVGQVMGLSEQFDHLAFFRRLAEDLKARGY
jgi:triacylglycerol esterase/lipase EstA (alpha/beta hydrolase family)